MLFPRRKWKDIEGYEGYYQVSNIGEVRSLDRYVKHSRGDGKRLVKGRLIKPRMNRYGYKYIELNKNGKSKSVEIHRLVALHFVEGYFDGAVVNHKDENKTNNIWTNLEWCTRAYNTNYGTRLERAAKSKSKPVRCIETGQVFNSIVEADKWIGRGNVCVAIKRGGTAGGYHWKYIDE